jgi:hypothetical protein
MRAIGSTYGPASQRRESHLRYFVNLSTRVACRRGNVPYCYAASAAGLLPPAGSGVYAASQHAVVATSECLYHEFRELNATIVYAPSPKLYSAKLLIARWRFFRNDLPAPLIQTLSPIAAAERPDPRRASGDAILSHGSSPRNGCEIRSPCPECAGSEE